MGLGLREGMGFVWEHGWYWGWGVDGVVVGVEVKG